MQHGAPPSLPVGCALNEVHGAQIHRIPTSPAVQHDAEAPWPNLQWFILGGCWAPLIQVHTEALLGQVDGTQGACGVGGGGGDTAVCGRRSAPGRVTQGACGCEETAVCHATVAAQLYCCRALLGNVDGTQGARGGGTEITGQTLR